MHLQALQQSLEAAATSMLASRGDRVLQNQGIAAMLALTGCDTRPIGPGVYDVNSTDREGCTVLHKWVCMTSLCCLQMDFHGIHSLIVASTPCSSWAL